MTEASQNENQNAKIGFVESDKRDKTRKVVVEFLAFRWLCCLVGSSGVARC